MHFPAYQVFAFYANNADLILLLDIAAYELFR